MALLLMLAFAHGFHRPSRCARRLNFPKKRTRREVISRLARSTDRLHTAGLGELGPAEAAILVGIEHRKMGGLGIFGHLTL